MSSARCATIGLIAIALIAANVALAHAAGTPLATSSLANRSVGWPSSDQLNRVLLLRDYNTRVVVIGTTLLGLAAGTIGSFTLLRKRALMGDALSHATLPGIYLAFIVGTQLGIDGKSLPLLLSGAAISGMLGVAVILMIRNTTRLKEDAALGIVLSVFFGAGIALRGLSHQTGFGNAAGLDSFILGKTASMLARDAWIIGISAAATVIGCVLLYKELRLLCFDETFAGSEGFRVLWLDTVLMAGVVIVTIVGLQAVGLILIIALLVTPAAAARFWTSNLTRMIVLASSLGACSGLCGSIMSALFPRLPSGAMIVLSATGLFLISMLIGPARGVIPRFVRRHRLLAKIDRQHLLRGIYELLESSGFDVATHQGEIPAVEFENLLALRSWSTKRLRQEIREAASEDLLRISDSDTIIVSAAGYASAARLTHQHRLWEMYLITHAEIAPSQVDRNADAIEHILKPEMIDRLERLLEQKQAVDGIASSPHPL